MPPATVATNHAAFQLATTDPLVNTEIRPGYDFASKRSIHIVPLYGTEFATSLTETQELQAMAVLRYNLEYLGYEVTDNLATADLLVAIDYAENEYKSSYVPPSTITVPVYVPGQTSTATSYSNYWGSYYGTGGFASGTASGRTTTTYTTPGTWSTRTATRGGYTTGAYYPALALNIFDSDSHQLVYSASYVAVSQAHDLRLAMPWGIVNLLHDLPLQNTNVCNINPLYTVGLMFLSATIDGNRYFPTVGATAPDVEYVEGQLLQADLITAVNGTSMQNATFCETLRAFNLRQPGAVTLDVHRAGQNIQVVVQKTRF